MRARWITGAPFSDACWQAEAPLPHGRGSEGAQAARSAATLGAEEGFAAFGFDGARLQPENAVPQGAGLSFRDLVEDGGGLGCGFRFQGSSFEQDSCLVLLFRG